MQKYIDLARLRNQFPGSNTIEVNYSQADQDIFVLSMLNGKRNGTWLEIGCAWPQNASNTALLEQFGWSGLSIDSYRAVLDEWPGVRTTVPVHQCAYKADWIELLHQKGITHTDIDYLSLDCDPAEQTLDILRRIPFDRLRFAVITFEHDCHGTSPAVKLASRDYLSSHGYKLVASNISEWGLARDFEDWWVHPDLVDADLITMHTATDDTIKPYETYLYGLVWSDQFAQNRL